MIIKPYYILIEADKSSFSRYVFQSCRTKDLEWASSEFADAVRLVLDKKLHADHIYLMCNDYILNEFHIYKLPKRYSQS